MPLVNGRRCAYVVPQVFANATGTKWEGGCQDGKAHGHGILRAYEGKRVVETFYGLVERGELKRGVVDNEETGYGAGRFGPGGVMLDAPEGDEFNDRYYAVNEAEAAARQVSASFAAAGNKGSAAYYEKKADFLYQQIE